MERHYGSTIELENRLCEALNQKPDVRRKVTILNKFSKEIASASQKFNQSSLQLRQLPDHLLEILIGSVNLHPTAKDIVRHALDTLAFHLGSSFLECLGTVLEQVFRMGNASIRLSICEELLKCSVSRELISQSASVPKFVEDLMATLSSFTRKLEGSVEDSVRLVQIGTRGVMLIKQIISFLPPGDVLNKTVETGCVDYLNFGNDRHPDLLVATAHLFYQIYLGEQNHFPKRIMETIQAERPGFSTVVSVIISQITDDDFIEFYRDLKGLTDGAFSSFPRIGVSAVVHFCGKISHLLLDHYEMMSNLTDDVRQHFLEYWKAVVESLDEQVLSKSVEIAGFSVAVWDCIFPDSQDDMLGLIAQMSWLSIYKQRMWITLLPTVGQECFRRFEKATPLELLEMIPNHYFKFTLATLLTLIATEDDIANIFAATSKYNAFLMKSVLPAFSKRLQFLPKVFELVSAREAISGYGPLLFTFRTVRQIMNDALRHKILDLYIYGTPDLAVHSDDLVRMEAFCFLCKYCDPLTKFDRVAHFVRANANHQFLKFREPFLRGFVEFLHRLEIACRQARSREKDNVLLELVRQKMSCFLEEMVHECVPSSAYSRRTTALHVIKQLLTVSFPNTGNDALNWDHISRTLMEQLFWESFPDNQNIIMEIIALRNPKDAEYIGGFSCQEIISLADQKARSCVTNNCRSGVCLDLLVRCTRLSFDKVLREVMDQIITDVVSAKTNGVSWAARNAPLYGQLFRLRNILSSAPLHEADVDLPLVIEILGVCRDVEGLINDALISNATGLSMDKTAVQEDDQVEGEQETTTTSQMLFVCCWRNIREIALLYTELCCGKATWRHLKMSDVEVMFRWMISQILTVPYTGAFESLAEQLPRVCAFILGKHPVPGLVLIRQVLDDILDELRAWNSPLKLENTRKSAGVPRLLCIFFVVLRKSDAAVLVLNETLSTLVADASVTTTKEVDGRVRAINVMEGLFRENALNELTDAFVGKGVIVAADGMASDLWPIRNAAACLFTALMQRIFGPAVKRSLEELQWRETCLPAANVFADHPALFDYVKNCLTEKDWSNNAYDPQDRHTFKLFCVLTLLSRLYSGPGDPWYCDNLACPLESCLRHPDLRIREVAAKAYVLALNTSVVASLADRLPEVQCKESDYYLHGILLAVQEIERNWACLVVPEVMCPKLLHGLGIHLEEAISNTYVSYTTSALLLKLARKFHRGAKGLVLEKYIVSEKSTFLRPSVLREPGYDVWADEYFRTCLCWMNDKPGSISTILSKKLQSSASSYLIAVLLNRFADFVKKTEWTCDESLPVFQYVASLDVGSTNVVLAAKLNVVSAILESTGDFSENVYCKILHDCLFLLQSVSCDSDIITAALKVSSIALRLLTKTAQRPVLECWSIRYVQGLSDHALNSPNMEVRLACARTGISPIMLSFGQHDNQNVLDCYHWVIFINLLRDDENTVRVETAKRVVELGLSELPCTSGRTIRFILDYLVRSYTKRGLLARLIYVLTVEYMNDDDRILGGETVDSSAESVFELSDRHEYHENMWLIDQLRHSVQRSQEGVNGFCFMKRDNDQGDGGCESCQMMGVLAKEIEVCRQQLLRKPFLHDMSLFNRAVFRLFFASSAVACLCGLCACGSDMIQRLQLTDSSKWEALSPRNSIIMGSMQLLGLDKV